MAHVCSYYLMSGWFGDIMVRQEDKAKIRNVKVITSEECVPKQTVSNGYAV